MTDDSLTNADLQRLAAQAARKALSDEVDRHLIASMQARQNAAYMTDQAQTNRAIEAYEEARMTHRPKPKFILHIDGNHFHANRRRATLWDVLFVAIATATWLALLASIYLVFK
jgi:hypothetical protein